jgi:hypothetical protein
MEAQSLYNRLEEARLVESPFWNHPEFSKIDIDLKNAKTVPEIVKITTRQMKHGFSCTWAGRGFLYKDSLEEITDLIALHELGVVTTGGQGNLAESFRYSKYTKEYYAQQQRAYLDLWIPNDCMYIVKKLTDAGKIVSYIIDDEHLIVTNTPSAFGQDEHLVVTHCLVQDDYGNVTVDPITYQSELTAIPNIEQMDKYFVDDEIVLTFIDSYTYINVTEPRFGLTGSLPGLIVDIIKKK